MITIKVKLDKRSYPIYIGYGIYKQLRETLPEGKGVVITDSNVSRYWGKVIKSLKLPVISVSPGEKSKAMKVAEEIYLKMLKYGLDRHSYIIAFGGGVVGDLSGFVASTYMRGISYIQVPTTLMAQVDSSIGGKTGVNLHLGKNLAGSFWQPKFVFVDTKFLETLPKKEIRNGLAEVIKYGMIKDRNLFTALENSEEDLININVKKWVSFVKKCAKIKADIVGRDERETKGLRMILNYGHTMGHAIESVYKYKHITHGEAVALGMIVSAKLSNHLGFISNKDLDRQNKLINDLVSPDKEFLSKHIIKKIKYDKKMSKGLLRFVLVDRIGHAFITNKINNKVFSHVL